MGGVELNRGAGQLGCVHAAGHFLLPSTSAWRAGRAQQLLSWNNLSHLGQFADNPIDGKNAKREQLVSRPVPGLRRRTCYSLRAEPRLVDPPQLGPRRFGKNIGIDTVLMHQANTVI